MKSDLKVRAGRGGASRATRWESDKAIGEPAVNFCDCLNDAMGIRKVDGTFEWMGFLVGETFVLFRHG